MSFGLNVTLPNVVWAVGSYNQGSGFYTSDATTNPVTVSTWVWNPTLLSTGVTAVGAVNSNGAAVTDGGTTIIGTVTDLSMNFTNTALNGNIASSITIDFYGIVSAYGSSPSPLQFSITAYPSISGSNIVVSGNGGYGSVTSSGTYSSANWQVEMFNTTVGQPTSLASTYGNFTFSFALITT